MKQDVMALSDCFILSQASLRFQSYCAQHGSLEKLSTFILNFPNPSYNVYVPLSRLINARSAILFQPVRETHQTQSLLRNIQKSGALRQRLARKQGKCRIFSASA